MPSIFIWKADQPLSPNSSTMRYYHGVDWCLQEDDDASYSCSFQYLAQDIYPEFTVFTAKSMKSDWVGEDLLEVRNIPYHIIHSSNGIRIHQIGTWIQCIYHSTHLNTEEQWQMIQKILSNPENDQITTNIPNIVTNPIKDHNIGHNNHGGYGGHRGRGDRSHRGRGGRRGGGRGGYHASSDVHRAIVRV